MVHNAREAIQIVIKRALQVNGVETGQNEVIKKLKCKEAKLCVVSIDAELFL